MGPRQGDALKGEIVKLELSNIGRIASGEIKLRPFTMFIGKNDSGKTYAASTLWAFLDFVSSLQRDSLKDILPDLEVFPKGLPASEAEFVFEFSKDKLDGIRAKIVDQFNQNIGTILESAIGYDGFGGSRVSVESFKEDSPLYLKVNVTPREEVEEIEIDLDEEIEDDGSRVQLEQVTRYDIEITAMQGDVSRGVSYVGSLDGVIVRKFVEFQIASTAIGFSVAGMDWLSMRQVIYLPAARTGIMLAVDYFVNGALERTKLPTEQLAETASLPAPIQNFAVNVSRPNYFGHLRPFSLKRRDPLRALVQGEVKRRSRRGEFVYAMDNREQEIPLASTSSLVTELAALSMLAHRVNDKTLLIFEEPEAHLHLAAQREMAHALAKMVKAGAYILITTHSDTFIQQVNNLISLSQIDDQGSLASELGVSSESVLSKDMVGAYDFNCEDGRTEIVELEVSSHGVVADSLNKVLMELTEETLKISERLPDDFGEEV